MKLLLVFLTRSDIPPGAHPVIKEVATREEYMGQDPVSMETKNI